MQSISQIRIFLASPGDVADERRKVKEIVAELNRTVARDKGVTLEVITWEEDTYAAIGGDPQNVINKQIADMATFDLFVGIMWNRIGTPTPRAESGTIEEYQLAVRAHEEHHQPEILFYFNLAPKSFDTREEVEQKAKVLDFRDNLRETGLPKNYNDSSAFSAIFRHDLNLWLTKATAKTPTPPHNVAGEQPEPISNKGAETTSNSVNPKKVNSSGAWAFLDDMFFVSDTVEHLDDGDVRITIFPLDDEEDAKLRSLQTGAARHSSIPYAYQNEASVAELRAARLTSKAGKTRWEIDIKCAGNGTNNFAVDVTFNGMSSGATAEKRARLMLLNDVPPKSELDNILMSHSFTTSFGTPRAETGIFPGLWAQFKGNSETFLPLARLFAVYHLLTSGTVEQILEFTLGPIQNDELQVKFRGRRKKFYTNVEAEVIDIQGTCKLTERE